MLTHFHEGGGEGLNLAVVLRLNGDGVEAGKALAVSLGCLCYRLALLLRQCLLGVRAGVPEHLELRRVVEVRAPRDLLYEAVQHLHPEGYDVLARVADGLFGWDRRDVDSWPIPLKRFPKSEELREPPGDIEAPSRIISLNED